MDINFFWELSTLAVSKTISSTARNLNMTQPTLSKHIAAAERELGVRLVERVSGSPTLTLTPAGRFVSEKGVEILNIWNEINANLPRYRDPNRIVRIAVTNSLVFHDAMDFLRQWAQDDASAPTLERVTTLRDHPGQALKDGEADLVLDVTCGKGAVDGTAAVTLFEEPSFLMVHKDDELANIAELPAKRLCEIPLLLDSNPVHTNYGWQPHAICNAYGKAPKIASRQAYDSDIAMYLEQLAPGVAALVPASLMPSLAASVPCATFVPLTGEHASFQFGILSRKTPTPAAQAVANALVSHFAETLPTLVNKPQP